MSAMRSAPKDCNRRNPFAGTRVDNRMEEADTNRLQIGKEAKMKNHTRTVAASAAVAATLLAVGSHESAQAQSRDDFGTTPGASFGDVVPRPGGLPGSLSPPGTPAGMSLGDTGIGTPTTPGLNPPGIGTPTTPGIGSSLFPSLGSGIGDTLGLGLTSGVPGIGTGPLPGFDTSTPMIGTSLLPSIGTSRPPGIGTSLTPGIGTSLPPGIGTSLTPGIGTPTVPSIGTGTPPGSALGSPSTIDRSVPLDLFPPVAPGAGAGATFGGGGVDPDSFCAPEDFTCLD